MESHACIFYNNYFLVFSAVLPQLFNGSTFSSANNCLDGNTATECVNDVYGSFPYLIFNYRYPVNISAISVRLG